MIQFTYEWIESDVTTEFISVCPEGSPIEVSKDLYKKYANDARILEI